MLSMEALESILSTVERPGRYIGGEVNSLRKPFGSVDFRLAIAFPDIYDIAMSNLALQILYGLVNAREDSLAERVFMPWLDMEQAIRAGAVPLFSLESHAAVRDFDAVGFSLQYEVWFPTVLKMLDLAGIPRRREARSEGRFPLVIGGGPCTFNPEPVADFFDLFFVGDAEETLPAFIDVWKKHRRAGNDRLLAAAVREVPGLYAPGLYTVERGLARPASASAPPVVKPSFVRDLDAAYYPTAPVIPFVEAVHERVSLEIMRGCSRGCRFCQPGMTKRPLRVRSVARLLELAEASYRNTGYDEISLLSLATGDYPHLVELTRRLNHRFAPLGVSLSFPSLRADVALRVIPETMAQVRKGSITVAAEAATDRLRAVINKGITEDAILEGMKSAFAAGWRRVKLYFMAGLPTETVDDVRAIAALVEKVLSAGGHSRGSTGVSLSVAPFVPKPGTPFQWEPMASRAYLEEARELLFRRLRGGSVKVSFHNIDRSLLEGALSRGGRELGHVIDKAADLGCFLDAWDEVFDYSKWLEAFASAGLNLEEYACRRLQTDAPLPWSHISPGVGVPFLLREREKALAAALTPDCRSHGCNACGLDPGACLTNP